jgi:hypothetical protein
MINSAALSIRRKLQKEHIFDGVSAGDLIATLKGTCSDDSKKLIISLLGADLPRTNLLTRLLQMEKAVTSPSFYMTADVWGDLTKKDAFRIYSLFPRFVAPANVQPDCGEEKDVLDEVKSFYLLSGLWLLNWEKSSRYSEALKTLGIDESEKRAWVSRRLYDLCDYMKIHSDSPYLKPLPVPAIWLLCEISICKKRLENKSKEGSKRKRYDRMTKFYAKLDSADPSDALPIAVMTGLPDLAKNFYGYFLHLAKRMAIERPDFDEIFFAPYLKAEKVWGRKALGGTAVTGYL